MRQVLGVAEAELAVEVAQRMAVRREDLEVVDALRVRALEQLALQVQALAGLHLRAQLEPGADRVGHVQRTPLVRHLRPFGRQAALLEVRVGGVQVLLEEDAEADALAGDLAAGLHQHQAVVAGLGQAAQVALGGRLFGDDEADDVCVEVAAALQVRDVQSDVARPRDVEGRTQVDGGQHGLSPTRLDQRGLRTPAPRRLLARTADSPRRRGGLP